jgi:tetratricopeptide (TPR) repeat protein
MALTVMGRYDEAAASLTRALEIDPQFRPARVHRGNVYWFQNKLPQAVDDFSAALEPPESERVPLAAYYRGMLYLGQGHRRALLAALADFDLAVAANKDLRQVYPRQARVCFLRGDYARGKEALRAFLREGANEPPETDVLQFYASQLHKLAQELPEGPARTKHLQVALAALQEVIKKQEPSGNVCAEMGEVLHRLGDVGGAIAWYGKALDRGPEKIKAEVLEKRGWLWEYFPQPNYEAAIKDFAEAVRLKPEYGEAHAGLGYMHACLLHHDLALRHANLAVLHKGGDYLVLHNAACIYAKLATRRSTHRAEYEDIAIDLLRRGVELWGKDKHGPDPIVQIQMEEAFSLSMRARPEFKKLLGPP